MGLWCVISRLLKLSPRAPISGNALLRAASKSTSVDPFDGVESRLMVIKAAIDADPESYIQQTEPLRESDFTLMGKILQCYCYADLNARRIIDVIRLAESGPEKQNAGRLADAQVFSTLRDAAALLPPAEHRDGILRAVDTISMHVVHRHTFAHWAARRVKGHNVLVLWTYNAREAEKRDGELIGAGELKYALSPLAPMVEELRKIEGHSEYLAHAAARLHSEVGDLRNYFAERKEARRAANYAAGIEKGKMKGERRSQKSLDED